MSDLRPRVQTLAQLIPPLTYDLHKGDCGRVAAIGGCEEYTGAPYFVASSALRLGNDIAYVVCEKDAATVIKSYSPDLIVNPYLRSVDNQGDRSLDEIEKKINPLLDKLHAVAAGSGLGNDTNIHESVRRAIKAARERSLPIVLDADALALVTKSPDIISGYQNAVLTPNPPEFARLSKALGVSTAGKELPVDEAAQIVAQKLGGVTIVRKGKKDIITNGQRVFVCDEAGGLRRCGGQGDLLTGATLTFLAWGEKYKQGMWKPQSSSEPIKHSLIPMHAAYAACMLARHASFLAYEECGRATTSTNVLEQIDIAFDNKFEEILKAVKPSKT
ncbi:carbohydrate kinase [Coemansia reversa NRRL 1564]|uniref:ATP-dependent (S)-NAD(P)H-hydrate dehydratase n=1 Tax=Coemansia reversa (strain ATCC 12441 / NRRL 1564) TaxID=763665 RepID=A0A2G5B8A3_COERN|nr:carbohydrate kinase [Coemansia reversa NRRL 1564]|eukprot:PIA15256.1 carbohydrate kinase [Coemansia reversa NRRL 1564]